MKNNKLIGYLKSQYKFLSFYSRPKRLFGMVIYNSYIFIFARPSMQFLSIRILRLALNGVGYNNWWNFSTSGEEKFLQLLSHHDIRVAIDIGANKGAYSGRLLEYTEAKVIAFEPLPKEFKELEKIKEKYPERFFPVAKGVGSSNEVLELQFGYDNSELASFCRQTNQIDYVKKANIEKLNVEVISLDHFVENFSDFKLNVIDFIKIDAEGFEHEILVGARNVFLQYKPKFIQIEFNEHQLFRGHTLYSFAAFLPNYRVFQLLPFGSGLTEIDPRKLEYNIFSFSNFVFVRDDVKLF